MKKLVFAAIAAAFVFVSVNNAVANNKIENTGIAPIDTVIPEQPDTTQLTPEQTPEQPDSTQQTPEQPDTTQTPVESIAIAE